MLGATMVNRPRLTTQEMIDQFLEQKGLEAIPKVSPNRHGECKVLKGRQRKQKTTEELFPEAELRNDAARQQLHRIGKKTIRPLESEAREIIGRAEADLGELSRGMRRDLLKDNTEWDDQVCDAVEEYIFVTDNPPFEIGG